MSKVKQEINKEKILEALGNVVDIDSKLDVVSAGIISSVVVRGNSVGFALEVDINKAHEKEDLRMACEDAVKNIKGVDKVTAVLTSVTPGILSERTKREKIKAAATRPQEKPLGKEIPGVKSIIAVMSGKGGVGKSTVAVNIARALAKSGKKVGIADIDIYGPSVPKMLGLHGKPEITQENKMVPKESEGIKSISIGYLIDEDNAMVWRSSMALKAMNQLFRATDWGELDYLIVDTPPGTGDIQLTLSKSYALSGAVLVSTPQEIALLDVKKATNMLNKVNVPILGVVENMSYFLDDSGKKNYIFGQGSVKKFAEELNIDFLGEIPIRQDIRESSDEGRKIVGTSEFESIAEKISLI